MRNRTLDAFSAACDERIDLAHVGTREILVDFFLDQLARFPAQALANPGQKLRRGDDPEAAVTVLVARGFEIIRDLV